MLQDLSSFYSQTQTSRITPQWKQYVTAVHIRQELLQKRYTSLSILPTTYGSVFLQRILRIADPHQLAKRGDNFYILSTQIPSIREDIQVFFDGCRNGRIYYRMFSFSQNTPKIPEYITAPLDNNWLSYLPMTSVKYSAWEKIAPLSLWWYEGAEQTFDLFTTGYLRFHTTEPEMVFWVLDVTALIMKAVAWVRTYPTASLEDFIKVGVVASITQDAENLWYFKLHRSAVDVALGNTTKEFILQQYPRSQSQYSFIGPRFGDALDELIDVYKSVANGSLSEPAVLNQPFLHGNNTAFRDICNSIDLQYDIPHHVQYGYLRLLRDLPYLDYLVDIYNLNMSGSRSMNFRKRLLPLMIKWRSTVPFSIIRNLQQQELVKRTFAKWDAFVSQN